MKIRKCRCCGEEYDLDNCSCKGWCERCQRCELHCAGHVLGKFELDGTIYAAHREGNVTVIDRFGLTGVSLVSEKS